MARHWTELEHGLVVGAISAAASLLILYSLAAPTTDYRERVAFLIGANSGRFVLTLFGIFAIIGNVVLTLTRQMSKRGALGVLIGAGGVAFTFRPRLLTRLLPEFPELYQRWLAAAMVAAVAAFALWREHQLYSGRVQDALGRGDTI